MATPSTNNANRLPASIRGIPTDLRTEFQGSENDRFRARLDPAIYPSQRRDQARMASTNELGNTVRFGYGWMEGVEQDSELRLNPDGMTNPRERVQLVERPFGTVPYMGRGGGDVELETMLLPGTEERDMKSCLPKSTAGVDRLDYTMHWNPQVPGCVIFPGIRGGEGTRAAMRRPLKVPCPVYASKPFQGSYQQ